MKNKQYPKKDNEADLSKLNAAYDKPVTPTVALQNSYDTFRHYLQEAVDNHWINNTYGDANGTHLSEQEDVALFLKTIAMSKQLSLLALF